MKDYKQVEIFGNEFEKRYSEFIAEGADEIYNNAHIAINGVGYSFPYVSMRNFCDSNTTEEEAIQDVGKSILDEYGETKNDNNFIDVWADSKNTLAEELLEVAESDMTREEKVKKLGEIAYFDLKEILVKKYSN